MFGTLSCLLRSDLNFDNFTDNILVTILSNILIYSIIFKEIFTFLYFNVEHAMVDSLISVNHQYLPQKHLKGSK